MNSDNSNLDETYKYDVSLGTWTEKASMSYTRNQFALTACNDKIYAIGDYDTAGGDGRGKVEVYDPDADSWSAGAALDDSDNWYTLGTSDAAPGDAYTSSNKATFASATCMGGLVYLVGGWCGATPTSHQASVLDPSTDRWSALATTNYERMLAATDNIDGKLYTCGGWGCSTPTPDGRSKLEEYDPSTDTWTEKTAPPNTCGQSPAGGVINGEFYVYTQSASDIMKYNPGSNSWTTLTSLSGDNLNYMGGAVIGTLLYFAGGSDTKMQVYNSTGDSWSEATGDLPSARSQGRLVTLW